MLSTSRLPCGIGSSRRVRGCPPSPTLNEPCEPPRRGACGGPRHSHPLLARRRGPQSRDLRRVRRAITSLAATATLSPCNCLAVCAFQFVCCSPSQRPCCTVIHCCAFVNGSARAAWPPSPTPLLRVWIAPCVRVAPVAVCDEPVPSPSPVWSTTSKCHTGVGC